MDFNFLPVIFVFIHISIMLILFFFFNHFESYLLKIVVFIMIGIFNFSVFHLIQKSLSIEVKKEEII